MRNTKLLLAILLSALPAAAERPPGPPPGHSGPHSPHGPPKVTGSAAPAASAQHERIQERREQTADRLRERMQRMQDRMHELRERQTRARALGLELREDLKNGNPRPEELKKKLEEWRSLRDDRRHEQRAFLQRRWGRGVSKPETKDELELHARRLARLQRLEELAATERSGEPRKRLIARIEQLRALEEKRHEEAMKKLVPDAPPAALASAEPAAVAPPAEPAPALATSAVPAVGAGQ